MPEPSTESDTTRPCYMCGGSGQVDTSPPEVTRAPWLESDMPCPRCGGSGEWEP